MAPTLLVVTLVLALLPVARAAAEPATPATGTPVAAPAYSIEALGLPPTPQIRSVNSVNDAGDVVGELTGFDELGIGVPLAYLWSDGAVTELGAIGGWPESEANDLNGLGQVVGTSVKDDGQERAFLWSDGAMTELGTLGGTRDGAHGINDAGQIVGLSETAGGLRRAVLWADGAMTELGPSTGESEAFAINEAGQIVGWASPDGGGGARPWLWSDGTETDLVGLGGARAYATAINDAGQVVGTAEIANGDEHAFFWEAGQIRDLGTLGGANSYAMGINEQGQVVGWTTTADGDFHQVLWTDGGVFALDALIPADSGWTGFDAGAIDDAGRIFGTAEYGGERLAFVMTPVDAGAPAAGAIWSGAGQHEPAARRTGVQGEGEVEDSFTDPIYGWSIAWDPETWEFSGPNRTAVNEDWEFGTGVNFGGGELGLVSIAGFPAFDGDPEECLDELQPQEGVNNVENVREPDLELPEAGRDVEQGLFLFDDTSSEDLLVYVECRTLVEDEAVLSVRWRLNDSDREYEDALPAFEELLAGLDLSDVHPGEGNVVDEDDRPTEEGGDNSGNGEDDEADGESFIDSVFGWSIAWDAETWDFSGPTQTEANEDGEYGNAVSFSGTDFFAHGLVIVGGYTLFADPADCLDGFTPREGEDDGVEDVREPDLDPPQAPDDAEQGIFLVTLEGTGEVIEYVECRVLVEDEAVLAIVWFAFEPAGYEEALPVFEELIAELDLSDVHPGEDNVVDD